MSASLVGSEMCIRDRAGPGSTPSSMALGLLDSVRPAACGTVSIDSIRYLARSALGVQAIEYLAGNTRIHTPRSPWKLLGAVPTCSR
eukprot:2041430-Alexandrium_andersonii.AAC.1